MKTTDIRVGKVHKDCPFTREEIIEMKAMLYSVNTSHHCANPAPISWAVAWQQHEQVLAGNTMAADGRQGSHDSLLAHIMYAEMTDRAFCDVGFY